MTNSTDRFDQIRSGDLVVWSTMHHSLKSRIFSYLIRLFTMSEYSHVGIAYESDDQIFVIEATSRGVVMTPISKYKNYYHIPLNISQWHDHYTSFLFDKIGQPYSYLDAIRGYLKLLSPSVNEGWQCAELANAFYRYIGIDVMDALTPSKLVTKLLELGYSIQYVK